MISGKILRDAIISGANNINNQRSRVDELNVFPVPDGDTGTNMACGEYFTAFEIKLENTFSISNLFPVIKAGDCITRCICSSFVATKSSISLK